MTKLPPKKQYKFKSALKRSRLTDILDSTDSEQLGHLVHELHSELYWWLGDPTEERILALKQSIPLLDKIIAFDIVLKRLDFLQDFERTRFGVKIGVFFPELEEIYEEAANRFDSLPPSAHKAECWLRPIAENAGAGADVEAAIYLASRRQGELVDVEMLRDSWHAAVCLDIERGKPIGQVPESVLERARTKTISLSEAAEVLTFQNRLPRFFGFRDQEENFIDAALFRAVEWFGITGFEPWLKSLISDLSSGPQEGVEHLAASWWLFFWCRADLALKMAEKRGLESWLWALINGPHDRDKPWRRFWPEQENPRLRDYLPTAGAILFIWHRISPVNMSKDILDRASELLSQTQMRCGAWPLHADASEPSLITTSFAIHGLALHRPKGWQKSINRAAEWIRTQQQPGGGWHISGGPAVMLTVLALDAIALAEGTEETTFNFKVSPLNRSTAISAPLEKGGNSVALEPACDFTKEPWFVSEIPPMTSVAISRAQEVANPRLAIIVATELELRYALNALTPLPRRRQIWKVTQGNDTYFLGKFGAFQCVLMLSSMSSQGSTGSTLSADAVIREWNPAAAVLLGIAFGASTRKQLSADVLVSEHIIPYEHQRVGEQPIFRNPVPPSSPALVNRFRNTLDWKFHRPDGSECSRHVGALLSGDKLIDNLEFKNSLLNQYPNAIGGEMEGAGFWAAADRARKDWIVVKGVCDWADGAKHKRYQPLAAASAVSLALHVFSDPHALDGL